MKHLSCVKFMNICINSTPQPNSDEQKDASDSVGKYDKQQVFQNDSSCLQPGVIRFI
jgi:hypothetical protein